MGVSMVITHPEMLPGEAAMVNALFANGLPRLHVRKPEASEAEVATLLEAIDPAFRSRIALHQHHQLAGAFGITRLHFTEAARLAQCDWEHWIQNGYTLSTSVHDPAGLAGLSDCFSYAFLGPVFDSISKKDYSSQLPSGFSLKKNGFPGKVVALGGITAQNVPAALAMGFDGVAALGSIWQDPEQAVPKWRLLNAACSQRIADIDRLHFISQETAEISHLDSIRLALDAGCRWIQLRVKNRPEAEVMPLAWEATRLCDGYRARLIINDFPRVALAAGAYGLHLGLTDMPVPEARALVGDEMVIGGTANTWADMQRRIAEGADYIGLGPYRFTHTKQNLSPILGLEGYQALMQKMQAAGHSTPIIAIGGIVPNDITGLRAAGVHGIALSGSLIQAPDPQTTFYQIQQALC